MQLLCTLRDHCRQWPRNTRYQAGRYPLLGPDFHRLDRTSFWLAHSFDHLVGGYEKRIWHREVECLGGFEVDDKSVHRWLLKWQIISVSTLISDSFTFAIVKRQQILGLRDFWS